MYYKLELPCFLILLGVLFAGCKDPQSPELTEKIYIVQTIQGLSVAEFAQNINEYSYPEIIKFTKNLRDYNFEGEVRIANIGWSKIENYEEYTGNTNSFFINVIGKLGPVQEIVFTNLEITNNTLDGTFYLSGPTIDTTVHDFTSVSQ